MSIIGVVVIKVAYIFLGLFYLKNSALKIEKPYLFYQAFKSYKLFNERLLFTCIPLIIVLELALSLFLITTVFQTIAFILGLTLQFFYLAILLINLNKNFKNNCNCFTFNLPQNVTLRSLINNLILLLAHIIVYGLWRKML